MQAQATFVPSRRRWNVLGPLSSEPMTHIRFCPQDESSCQVSVHLVISWQVSGSEDWKRLSGTWHSVIFLCLEFVLGCRRYFKLDRKWVNIRALGCSLEM